MRSVFRKDHAHSNLERDGASTRSRPHSRVGSGRSELPCHQATIGQSVPPVQKAVLTTRRSNSAHAHKRGPAAHQRPGLCSSSALENARGRREGRTSTEARGPPAEKMQAAGTTGPAGRARPSLRDGFNGCFAISPVRRACWPPFAHAAFASARPQRREVRTTRLDRPHRTCSPARKCKAPNPMRPPLPAATPRDDRPKRPSSSRRDKRDHRRDLPDMARPGTCDRLARRAVCAGRSCGTCPSGG